MDTIRAIVKLLPTQSGAKGCRNDIDGDGNCSMHLDGCPKLYAVTEDFKMGDKLTSDGKGSITWVPADNTTQLELVNNGMFKILAEISENDFDWIREGQTYDVFISEYASFKETGERTKSGGYVCEKHTRDVAYVKCPTCKTIF